MSHAHSPPTPVSEPAAEAAPLRRDLGGVVVLVVLSMATADLSLSALGALLDVLG
jgi:hypothetical protein